MSEFNGLSDRLRHTRRNFLKIGAIGATAATAVLYRSQRAAAQCEPDPSLCFCVLKGMRVRTVDGDREIQDLRIGDRIPTVFGGTRPIKAVSSHSYKRRDLSQPWDRRVLPVRIAASALAPGVPHADLYLTGGHSLLIDGMLFPAGSLINGTTITWYEARELDELEFFHVMFDSHDALYVEGAPCESLMAGDQEAERLPEYPGPFEARPIPAAICAPLGFNGGCSELRSRLRSALSPWFECRHRVDVIRDELDRRASVLMLEHRRAGPNPVSQKPRAVQERESVSLDTGR
jgi:Hint domain